jgi:hypothetical protein
MTSLHGRKSCTVRWGHQMNWLVVYLRVMTVSDSIKTLAILQISLNIKTFLGPLKV